MSTRYILHYCPDAEHLPSFNELAEKLPAVQHIIVDTIAKALDVVRNDGSTTSAANGKNLSDPSPLIAVVAKAGTTQEENAGNLFTKLRAQATGHGRPDVFNVLFSQTISQNPEKRLEVMENAEFNCHMVSHVSDHVAEMLSRLSKESCTGNLTCPICQKPKLTDEEMYYHLQNYHQNMPQNSGPQHSFQCPLCGIRCVQTPLLVHYHDTHMPPGCHADHQDPVALYSFGLCVIQRKSDGKFLVVQEFCNQGFWLPGGGIDPSEMPAAAAKRECLEEAGVDVELTGILRVEVSPGSRMTRNRYIFYGHPKDDNAVPKTYPDFESLGACWVSCDEVMSGRFRLRGKEPLHWFQYVAKGGQVMPLSMLSFEGASVEMPK